jgi:amino acid permease
MRFSLLVATAAATAAAPDFSLRRVATSLFSLPFRSGPSTSAAAPPEFESGLTRSEGALLIATVAGLSAMVFAVSSPSKPGGAKSAGTTLAQTTANLVKNVVGAGVLSLPGSVAAGTGLVPAVTLTLLLGCASAYTFSLIGRLCETSGKQNFKALGEWALGPELTRWISIVLIVKTFQSCLSYSLVIADTFTLLAATVGLPLSRTYVLLIMTVGVILPLCLMRDLSSLAIFSLLGSGGMMYTILFMAFRWADGSYVAGGKFYSGLPEKWRPNFDGGVDLWTVDVKSLVVLCTLSTAFISHYNAPLFYGNLQERSVPRFNNVVTNAFSIAIVMFVAVLAIGYLTFGRAASGLILNNYSSSDYLATFARVAVGGAIVFTYPLVFGGFRDGVQSFIPGAERFQLTVVLLCVITGSAFVFQNVGFVNALGGAVLGSSIIYIIPCMLFRCAREKGISYAPGEFFISYFFIVAGCGLAVLGSIVSVLQYYYPGVL